MWICVLDILISISTLVEPKEKETQRISSLSSNTCIQKQNADQWGFGISTGGTHWPLIPAICSGGRFCRTPESVNTVRTSWSGPSADTLTPTVTLVHFPHLVVNLRCNSDYALLCWNTMWLIVDLKYTGLMVDEDFYRNPACYFWMSVLLHSTFLASSNYLQFLEVSQSFSPVFCPWNACVPC